MWTDSVLESISNINMNVRNDTFVLRENVSLRKRNTFRMDVHAKFFTEITTEDQLDSLIGFSLLHESRLLILGKGANILFSGDFEGLVVAMRIQGRRIVSEDNETVIVEVMAGEDWSRLVADVTRQGLGGIENLAMVPGTVGGAAIQHIACYGQNLQESIVSVDALIIRDGTVRRFLVDECEFGYRDSIFRRTLLGKCVIVSVRLKLSKKPVLNTSYHSRYESVENELSQIAQTPYSVQDVYRAVVRIRRRKLPDLKRVGCAGSFFKNPVVSWSKFLNLRNDCPGIQHYPVNQLYYPRQATGASVLEEHVKVPAGWLVQELGLTGDRVGDCGIWPRQGINVVNYGSATPAEMLEYVESIRTAVLERYGILLENEVEIA